MLTPGHFLTGSWHPWFLDSEDSLKSSTQPSRTVLDALGVGAPRWIRLLSLLWSLGLLTGSQVLQAIVTALDEAGKNVCVNEINRESGRASFLFADKYLKSNTFLACFHFLSCSCYLRRAHGSSPPSFQASHYHLWVLLWPQGNRWHSSPNPHSAALYPSSAGCFCTRLFTTWHIMSLYCCPCSSINTLTAHWLLGSQLTILLAARSVLDTCQMIYKYLLIHKWKNQTTTLLFRKLINLSQ